jgi:hypothetical protein
MAKILSLQKMTLTPITAVWMASIASYQCGPRPVSVASMLC